MKENSSSQMGRFCSQWLLEIRFPCRDSEDSSDYSSHFRLLFTPTILYMTHGTFYFCIIWNLICNGVVFIVISGFFASRLFCGVEALCTHQLLVCTPDQTIIVALVMHAFLHTSIQWKQNNLIPSELIIYSFDSTKPPSLPSLHRLRADP